MVYSIKSEVLEPISEVDKFGVMVAHYTAQQGRYDIANRILDDLKAETPGITTVDVDYAIMDDVMYSTEHDSTKYINAVDSLTQSAQTELEQQERIISKGLDAWYEVGKAFETIAQKKLFGVLGYKSFKAYCKERWGKTDSAIFLYINAAQVRDEICEYVDIPPGNMSLYKELHKLPSLEDKVAVWDKVVATRKKISVKALRAAVNKHLGNTPKPKTTARIEVSVESAELIKASAKQANMTTQDLISKLLEKVLN